MKRILILTLILFSFKSFAQQDSVVIPNPYKYNTALYFFGGVPFYSYTALPNISAALEKLGFEAPNKHDFTNSSVGFGLRYKKIKIGVSTTTNLIGSLYYRNQTKSIYTRQEYYGTVLDFGYNFNGNREQLYFLSVGIGTAMSFITVQQKTKSNTPISFQNLTSIPLNTMTFPRLDLTNIIGEISIEIIDRGKYSTSGGLSGKIGYRAGLSSQPWSIENVALKDVPRDRIGQFFVQMQIYLAKNGQSK